MPNLLKVPSFLELSLLQRLLWFETPALFSVPILCGGRGGYDIHRRHFGEDTKTEGGDGVDTDEARYGAAGH